MSKNMYTLTLMDSKKVEKRDEDQKNSKLNE